MPSVHGTILNPGEAQGPVLVLDEPLSFWGAYDPATGAIIDLHHPQRGACLTGTILVLPATRGSGTAPGAIAEAVRRGTAPAAIVLGEPDVNLAIGCFIAAELYGRSCPVLSVGPDDYARVASWPGAAVRLDGTILFNRVPSSGRT
jgi:predicted aconitase with swiveling domain